MKSLKERLSDNKLTIGSWITLGNTAIAELMAKSGFDWLTIDMEHSSITLHEAQQLIQAIELSGCFPFVRVGQNDPVIIKRVMDAGAHGVIVPMVNTVDDAIKAVDSVKYPPKGKRGVGLARAQGYGLKFDQYKKWLEKESIVVVQIEHIDAMNNLEAILKVDGVDASIIGPYDLSASLGHPGEFERDEVKTAIREYVGVCNKLSKPAGFHSVSADIQSVNRKIDEGFKFMGYCLDTLFIGNKIESELKGLQCTS